MAHVYFPFDRVNKPEPRGSRNLIATVCLAGALTTAIFAGPDFRDGFVDGGREGVESVLSGLKVMPERNRIAGAFAKGLAYTAGKKVGDAFVESISPIVTAWYNTKTSRLDYGVWAGPSSFVGSSAVGRDDTTLNVHLDGHLTLAFRLNRFFDNFGFSAPDFVVQGRTERTDCECTSSGEFKVSSEGVVQGRWVSRNGVPALFAGRLDPSDWRIVGSVTTTFGGVSLRRPAVYGSAHERIADDENLMRF